MTTDGEEQGVPVRGRERARPAGPRARDAAPPHRGVGRGSSALAERVSDDLRRGAGDFLEQRRRVSALTLAAGGALGVVALYQYGLVRRVPEPRLPGLSRVLDADRVDASGEAYQLLRTPDSALGLASYAVTLVLAGAGARDRAQTAPLVPLLLAAKVAGDAASSLVLVAEQITQHRRLCSWCTAAAALSVAALPAALPEARAAWRAVRSRR